MATTTGAPASDDAAPDPAPAASPRTRSPRVDAPTPGRKDLQVGLDGLTRRDRHRLRLAWWVAALPVLAVYLWLLTAGQADLLQERLFDDFFDAQARSILDGRLDVPYEVVLFEGFLVDGRTYIYFGPVPALLRIPVLLVTDSLDGRLAIPSMLVAMVVLAVATFRLSCMLRALVRDTAPVGRREPLATAALAVATLVAPPFFLASATLVYHEAALWGVALAVAAFDAIVRYQRDPSGRRLAAASALVAASLLSRQSVGLGPLVALGLTGLMLVGPSVLHAAVQRDDRLRRLRAWSTARARGLRDWVRQVRPPEPSILPERDPLATLGADEAPHDPRHDGGDAASSPRGGASRPRPLLPARRALRMAGGLAVAVLVPVVATVGLNQAKFGTLFGPPFDRHVFSLLDPHRQEVLRASGGSLFGLQFAPTTLRQYFRPDAVDIRRNLPWIDFPRTRPTAVGDALFDRLDWASSLPVSAPALCALTLVAVVWLVRTRRSRRGGPWFTPLLVGAAACGLAVIPFAYVANRYLTDLFPAVLLPGLVGFHLAVRAGPRWGRSTLRIVRCGFVGLIALGAAVNLGLALSYQWERGPAVTEADRAKWISWRTSLPGAYEPTLVPIDRPLPGGDRDSTVAIVGDCAGVYQQVDGRWHGVERGPGVGVYDLVVNLDVLEVGERVPLLTLGRGAETTIVAIRKLDETWLRVDVSHPATSGSGWQLGAPVQLSGTVTIRVDADDREPPTLVTHGREVLHDARLERSVGTPLVGRAPRGYGVATLYPEDGVELAPIEPTLCRSIHPGSGDAAPGGA